MFKRWRRLDEPGLEVLRLEREGDNLAVSSHITFAGTESFGLRYAWLLDANWRTRTLRLEVMGTTDRALTIERTGAAEWRIDGKPRPDLNGCDELDVSATPFCNGLAIRRLAGSTGEITALYVLVPELSVQPSRQRYESRGERQWRYIDLGAVRGFEADLELDEDGVVRRYEGLFEAI
jgi:hypothetical protein